MRHAATRLSALALTLNIAVIGSFERVNARLLNLGTLRCSPAMHTWTGVCAEMESNSAAKVMTENVYSFNTFLDRRHLSSKCNALRILKIGVERKTVSLIWTFEKHSFHTSTPL
jgi:hypothetical protein